MFRFLSLTLTIVLGTSSAMAHQLECWGLYSKKGAQPALVAIIQTHSLLGPIRLNPQGPILSNYFGFGMQQPTEQVVKATFNNSPHSPYRGTNDYIFHAGGYPVRLVLPIKLDPATLQATELNGYARQNAMIDLPPIPNTGVSGDSYLRLHCLSK